MLRIQRILDDDSTPLSLDDDIADILRQTCRELSSLLGKLENSQAPNLGDALLSHLTRARNRTANYRHLLRGPGPKCLQLGRDFLELDQTLELGIRLNRSGPPGLSEPPGSSRSPGHSGVHRNVLRAGRRVLVVHPDRGAGLRIARSLGGAGYRVLEVTTDPLRVCSLHQQAAGYAPSPAEMVEVVLSPPDSIDSIGVCELLGERAPLFAELCPYRSASDVVGDTLREAVEGSTRRAARPPPSGRLQKSTSDSPPRRSTPATEP